MKLWFIVLFLVSMSYIPEPVLQSYDTGQRIAFLTLSIDHNIDVHKDV